MAHIKKIKVGTTDYDIDADLLDGKHASDIVSAAIDDSIIKIERINCGGTDKTFNISPNKYYIFNGVRCLTVNFPIIDDIHKIETGTRLDNYMFQFTFQGGNMLTLPDGIKWANGNLITSDIPDVLEDGGTYQISVINGLGVFSIFN